MSLWKTRVDLQKANIVDLSCDAIVNAANEYLASGGGVCGAIHEAAGPGLEHECQAIGHCPTGQAVITDAYNLPCGHVIHTVGPIYSGGADAGEASLLASCYRESLRLAAANGLTSIAFPSISTGIYGYPIEDACRIALASVKEGLAKFPKIRRVILVCFEYGDLDEYQRALAEME